MNTIIPSHTLTEVPAFFEWMVHLLEFSVVLGIAVMTYLLHTKKRRGSEVKSGGKEESNGEN